MTENKYYHSFKDGKQTKSHQNFASELKYDPKSPVSVPVAPHKMEYSNKCQKKCLFCSVGRNLFLGFDSFV